MKSESAGLTSGDQFKLDLSFHSIIGSAQAHVYALYVLKCITRNKNILACETSSLTR